MGKGGFSGFNGAGNMGNLMKQAQKLQKQMEDMQKEAEGKEFTSTVGGGTVTATATGKKELVSITIKPEVVDPEDIEMLQDLILSACNEALSKAEKETADKVKEISGGLNIPGLF